MHLGQPRREIKTEAKQILLQNARICTMISLAAGLFYLVVLLIQSNFAVGLILQITDPAVDNSLDAFSIGAGGLSLVLRLEDLRIVAKVSATLPQLTGIAIMELFSIVFTAPAIFGARALLCRISDGDKLETADLKGIFLWYTNLALAGRAILLYGMVSVLERVFQLFFTAAVLSYHFQGSGPFAAITGTPVLSFVVMVASGFVFLFGLLFAWSLLPAGWLTARNPQLSPSEALRRGHALLRGWTTDHFVFRFSFFLWYLLSLLSYHALLLFLFPYFQISEACYLKRLEKGLEKTLPSSL